jgi:superfamily II DNA or RNA helicase
MKRIAFSWAAVAASLRERAMQQQQFADDAGEAAAHLNPGQRASLHALADRIGEHGVVLADEVGMGKTRIAVELIRAVKDAGGRAAVIAPPGLGYQWQAELKLGGVTTPAMLRGLLGYFEARSAEEVVDKKPWFQEPILVLSHTFANWRMGENATRWRRELVPEVFARWRKEAGFKYPNGYHLSGSYDERVKRAAASIVARISEDAAHPAYTWLTDVTTGHAWPNPDTHTNYRSDTLHRSWLEQVVGFGLGSFDLLVIDEAHKSRGTDSGLSRLLGNLVQGTQHSRRLCMTATPVELDVEQWRQTFERLGLDEKVRDQLQPVINDFAQAIRHLRAHWRSSDTARQQYQAAASAFQTTLSPYLLRRDKREDADVSRFAQEAQGESYRNTQKPVSVDVRTLKLPWRQAVCATEALSVASRLDENSTAKRLRLTLANGHGIADLLAQINEPAEPSALPDDGQSSAVNDKRQQRVQWWLKMAAQAFQNPHHLFEHPAILATITAIEAAHEQEEKVLVFGRFTAPMRALVRLLNAREMLRSLEAGRYWPQSVIHARADEPDEHSEWAAVEIAHRQLNCRLKLSSIPGLLANQYSTHSTRREQLRRRLLGWLDAGLPEHEQVPRAMFKHLQEAELNKDLVGTAEKHPVALFTRAILDFTGGDVEHLTPEQACTAFCQLLSAAGDQHTDDNPHTPDTGEIALQWELLLARLQPEFAHQEGGFARLMYGGTEQSTRRLLQLAFNRPNSFPRVLVAQSTIGREGLNLHLACKTVILMHPEWNPGVVEQQIGRVDRVGSHWSRRLGEALARGSPAAELPRIDVHPVIFRGTYDEHNWQVLLERWDDLRAQLHGEVIPAREAEGDLEYEEMLAQLQKSAPCFSPLGRNI